MTAVVQIYVFCELSVLQLTSARMVQDKEVAVTLCNALAVFVTRIFFLNNVVLH